MKCRFTLSIDIDDASLDDAEKTIRRLVKEISRWTAEGIEKVIVVSETILK